MEHHTDLIIFIYIICGGFFYFIRWLQHYRRWLINYIRFLVRYMWCFFNSTRWLCHYMRCMLSYKRCFFLYTGCLLHSTRWYFHYMGSRLFSSCTVIKSFSILLQWLFPVICGAVLMWLLIHYTRCFLSVIRGAFSYIFTGPRSRLINYARSTRCEA